jgi:hypothetical protein
MESQSYRRYIKVEELWSREGFRQRGGGIEEVAECSEHFILRDALVAC